MKSLIIGAGEIGQALEKVLNKYYKVWIRDKDWGEEDIHPDIIHICFPYSENFVSNVDKYQRQYDPKYTIIHSTVPVGTARNCSAMHSPIIGIHPSLEQSLTTFTKFIGGDHPRGI